MLRTISFRLAIALSIIVAVIVVSIAAYYARQLSTTTTIKISPQEGSSELTSTTTSMGSSPTSQKDIIMRIGDWAITITLYDNGTGVLRVEYLGETPLTIENPLLPLTAGLDIALEYSDSSKNTVLRSLGTYYYNASITISKGNYSKVRFDSKDLTSIRIEGKILGKIPVRIYIPLTGTNCSYRITKTVTVTVTKTTGTQTTTTAKTSCKLELIGEYPEPTPSSLSREVGENQTIYTDNVVEVHVPLDIHSMRIPLIIVNRADTPLVLYRWYLEYEIINASFDGEHYVKVNRKIAYAVPTTTIPPWIMGCAGPGSDIRIWGVNEVLMPGQKTILTLDFPDDVLGGYNEAWAYIRLSLEYQGVRQLFRILLNNTVWKYSLAAKMYDETRELDMVFKIHIARES